MSAAVEVAKTLFTEVGPGNVFTIGDAYKLLDMNDHTLRNRVGEICAIGVFTRLARGKYRVDDFPPTDLEIAKRLEMLGGKFGYARLDGKRKPTRYEGQVRKINRLWRDPLYAAQNGICAVCGMAILHPIHASVDHYIPLADGGEDAPANLVVTHDACNASKARKSLADARDALERKGHPMNRHRANKAFNLGLEHGATCERNWYDN